MTAASILTWAFLLFVAATVATVVGLVFLLRWLQRETEPETAAPAVVIPKGEERPLGPLTSLSLLAAAVARLHIEGSANFQAFARHLRKELEGRDRRWRAFQRVFTAGFLILFAALLVQGFLEYRNDRHLQRVDQAAARARLESRDRFAVAIITNCLKVEKGNDRIRASLQQSLDDLLHSKSPYWIEHPKEYRDAIRRLRREIARFAPDPCRDPRTGRIVKKPPKLQPPG